MKINSFIDKQESVLSDIDVLGLPRMSRLSTPLPLFSSTDSLVIYASAFFFLYFTETVNSINTPSASRHCKPTRNLLIPTLHKTCPPYDVLPGCNILLGHACLYALRNPWSTTHSRIPGHISQRASQPSPCWPRTQDFVFHSPCPGFQRLVLADLYDNRSNSFDGIPSISFKHGHGKQVNSVIFGDFISAPTVPVEMILFVLIL